jgi:NAD(P)-dependent dehydrogenase (short-subunit alcohol dehydrogenase family)
MGLLDFSGKRVAIAGCYSGMGEAAARTLVELGAEVHGFDIRETALDLASFTTLDLRDPASIDAAIASFDGDLDCLFTCSGLPQTFPARDVMKVNFAGHRHWVEGWMPRIKRGGSVSSIASTAAFAYQQRLPVLMEFTATPDFAAATAWSDAHPDDVADGYGFSKEALCVYIMQRSKYAIQQLGVRMNALLPGLTETPMMPDFEKAASAAIINVFGQPINRRSTPIEQAMPLLFLGSDAASYINGHLLVVDGGFTAALGTGQIDLQGDIERAMAG